MRAYDTTRGSEINADTSRCSVWIISPLGDICFLIAPPLLIYPLVLLLANAAFTPEQIAIAVFAFASFGHHVPGLLRAYGDRELFQRFRYRFLVAPPLVLAASWISFVWLELNGLTLVLLFWATWHIAMQTYGFLRIYDSKCGTTNQSDWNRRLDFWTCMFVFAAGIAFSDARVFGIAEALANTGLPIFNAQWVAASRWIVGIATAVLTGAYLLRSLRTWRASAAICLLKLALLTSTAFLYWGTGQLAINVLAGVAMFEIFHAVQYYAIVWIYNRRRADRLGERFGLLGHMFRRHRLALPTYLMLLLVFGTFVFWGRHSEALPVSILTMLFSASAMLHFYYDGFMWRVRERATRDSLNIETSGSEPPSYRPGLWHGLQWGFLTLLLVALAFVENRHDATDENQQQQLWRLSSLTPKLPEAQIRMSQMLLLQGDSREAYTMAADAVRLRPRSYKAQLVFGNAAVEVADWENAESSFARAVSLQPTSADAHYGLGLAQLQLGHNERARISLSTCMRLNADHAFAHFQLGNIYYRTEEYTPAIAAYSRCIELKPDFADAYNNLGEAYFQLGQYAEAAVAYQRTVELQPQRVTTHFQLGNVYYATGQLELAGDCFRRCTELQPDFPNAFVNLGAVWFDKDNLPAAAAAYRKAIELQPNHAGAHYNLGLVLYHQGRSLPARRLLQRAQQLGHPIDPNIAAELGL